MTVPVVLAVAASVCVVIICLTACLLVLIAASKPSVKAAVDTGATGHQQVDSRATVQWMKDRMEAEMRGTKHAFTVPTRH